MTIPHAQARYHAASMKLVAYLDEHRVEMQIVTDTGGTVAVTCAKDSIFRVQRQIERMGRECPEIASWGDGLPYLPAALPGPVPMSAKHRLGALGLISALLILLALFAGVPAAAEPLAPSQQFQFELWAQNHCPTDAVVWVDGRSQFYNSSEERWYGRTTNGAFVCKRDAENAGYRLKPQH
jgi:hypothetical protein